MLRPAIALLWFVTAWLLYIPSWHPFGILSVWVPQIPLDILASVLRLGRYGLLVLILLMVGGLAAYGLGGTLLRLFGFGPDSPGGTIFSIGLGIGSLSMYTFFLGLLGGYTPAGKMVSAVFLLLAAVAGVYRAFRAVSRPIPSITSGSGAVRAAFFMIFAAVIVFLFSAALRPAVFYDAITYHLGVPNYWLQEGGISYIPYDSYSNFPFMSEMLYTLGMFMYGLKLAQFTSVLIFIMCVVVTYDIAKTLMPDMDPAFAGLIILATPAFLENVVQYSSDLYLTFFTLMVVYSYLMYERKRDPGLIVLMGVFAGISLGTKYVALVSILIPAIIAALYAAYGRRADGPREVALTVVRFALPALLVASPWYVRNLINTGNPFYPGLYGIFDGKDMSAACYAVHTLQHPAPMDALKNLIFQPYRIFFDSPSYLRKYYGYASYLGILLPMSMPLLLLVRRIPRTVKLLCLLSAMLFLMWNFAFPVTRFIFPAVAVMSLASAFAVSRLLKESSRTYAFVMGGVLIMGLAVNIWLGFSAVDYWSKSPGLEHMYESDKDYLMRRMADKGDVVLTSYPVYEYINENIPADARVLIIGDAQHLYIKRRHAYTYLSATEPFDAFLKDDGDPDMIADTLLAEGYTYIAYNPSEMARLQKSGHISFPKSMDKRIDGFLKSRRVSLIGSGGVGNIRAYLFKIVRRSSMDGAK